MINPNGSNRSRSSNQHHHDLIRVEQGREPAMAMMQAGDSWYELGHV
jgi:hypothetical protein